MCFLKKKKYLRGDGKEKTGEKYLERSSVRRDIEENVVDKSGLQATGCVALRKRVSFDTLYINNEILTKNHYALWN